MNLKSVLNSLICFYFCSCSFFFPKMAKKDSHSISFNLHGSIGFTNRIPTLFLEDYKVWSLHFKNYVIGIETLCSSIWHVVTKETYKYLKTKEVVEWQEHLDGIFANNKYTESDEKHKLLNNMKATKILRFTLPLDTFRLVSSPPTTKQI